MSDLQLHRRNVLFTEARPIIRILPQTIYHCQWVGVDEYQVNGSIEYKQPPHWQTEEQPVALSNLENYHGV